MVAISKAEKKELEDVIGKTMILRYSWKEALAYIETKIGHCITERCYYAYRRRIMKQGREWVNRMQQDHNAFLSEYRQRYLEMTDTQARLQKIANDMEHDNPDTAIRALMGYHQITNDIAALIDVLPYVAGGNNSNGSSVTNNSKLSTETKTRNSVF